MTIPPPPPAEQPLPPAGAAAPKLSTTTPTVPPTFTPADLAMLDELATAWHDADAAIVKATAMKAEAADGIKSLLPPGSTHMVPGTGVGVAVKRPAGRFDPAAAVDTLGPLADAARRVSHDPATLKALLKAHGFGDGMVPGSGGGTVTAAK